MNLPTHTHTCIYMGCLDDPVTRSTRPGPVQSGHARQEQFWPDKLLDWTRVWPELQVRPGLGLGNQTNKSGPAW